MAVSAWLDGRDPSKINLDQYKLSKKLQVILHQELAEQQRIGWHYAMRGYLSVNWSQVTITTFGPSKIYAGRYLTILDKASHYGTMGPINAFLTLRNETLHGASAYSREINDFIVEAK